MVSAHRERYRGPVRAVVLDLSGTIVDFGSRAPASAFVEVFRREGIAIGFEQAREPMGRRKRDHIEAIIRMPAVAAAWREQKGVECSQADVDRLYEAFVPIQLELLPRYGTLIPGALHALAVLRERGVRIATTTGYDRAMMKRVLGEMARQGLEPDVAICAEDVPSGRPAPWMLFRALEVLGTYPTASVIKVGDTLPDIEAGLNAGVWSVGVVLTGNMLGLSEREAVALPPEELRERLDAARQTMLRAGAHAVLDGVGELPELVEQIEARLGAGERP
jgi:phosphonoacetaldehyde hydrolase